MAALQHSSTSWLKGQLIVPGEPDYENARAAWNARVDRRPAVIARVADTDDVVRALAFARSSGLPVSVRGGSYNVAGTSVVDGGLVIEDEFSTINPTDGSRSLTLTYRVYNRGRKTWEIAGVNADSPVACALRSRRRSK